MSTSEKVLQALAAYDLKPERSGKYRCNSPFVPGSNSHGFTLVINDPEHGAWFDHNRNESGTLYQLAEKLGIEVPKTTVESTKRTYSGIADYAAAHGITDEILAAAQWYETSYQDRRALAFKTKTGTRWRFLDGQKPYYKSPKDYQRCWYGLNAAAMQRIAAGQPLVLCNGEISTVVGQHHGLAAACITGGEKDIPPHLVDELKAFLGAIQPEILVAMDCDSTGRRVSKQIENQLKALGYNAKALDLGLSSSGDLADFCMLYGEKAAEILTNLAPVLDIAATEAHYNRGWYILHASGLRELPPAKWIVTSLIPQNGIAVIFGAPGTGKSFVALDMALRVAQDMPVIYMAGEGEYGYPQRVAAWCKRHQKSEGQLYMCMGAVELLETGDLEAFLQAGEAVQPGVVFIDTLARSMIGGDENNQRDMGFFIAACDKIRHHWNCAIVILHHTNKGGQVERGSNVLRGSADVVAKINMEDDLICVECEKTKDAKPFDTYYLRLVPVQVETGGEQTESPVVIKAEDVVSLPSDSLKSNERKILEVLTLAVFTGGATAIEITDTAGIGRGQVHRTLSKLMDKGYVEQSARGEPYKITESGKNALPMNHLNHLNHMNHVNQSSESVAAPKTGDSSDSSVTSDSSADSLTEFGISELGGEVQESLFGDDDDLGNDLAAEYYRRGL